MSRIELGDTARDTITGFKGVVIARTQWINNCDRLMLQPPVDKEGKVPEACSFDEPSLELVKAGPAHKPVKTGGPRPEPRRQQVTR